MAFVKRRGPRVPIGNVVLAVAVMLLATATAAAPVPSPGVTQETVQGALRASLDRPGVPGDDVVRFYGARDFRPAWLGNPDAGIAIETMQGAAADGLDPARYLGRTLTARQRLSTAADAAEYDRTLTEGLLRYAQDLRRGQVDPAQADKMVGILRPHFDPVTSLETALAAGSLRAWLADLAPANPEYARLKAALARYRELVAKGGWPPVPAAKKILLEEGNPELVPLEKRLAVEDPQLDSQKPVDVALLEAAVRRFQVRNGLEADGVVGRQTIDALNISAAERAAQIEANMERWRWLPHEFPARYIAVNAADASLKVIENGKTILTSRVIVGKRTTPTAIFNANVIAVTINPPWDVPASIVRNEILPKLRRNPAYLARHHMVEMGGPYEIRQLPGADNALGYLKLEMPNVFTAYLHDTSSRKLFARDDRYLSHGCIRVQNIRPLASYVLTGSPETGLEKIDAAIEAGETQKLTLDRPVPVYVLYWTAIAGVDGTVEFRPDVYGRDKRLLAALAGRPKSSSASSDASSGCMGWKG